MLKHVSQCTEEQEKSSCISNLASYSKGFVFCFGRESVIVFERIEGFNFKRVKEIVVNSHCRKFCHHDLVYCFLFFFIHRFHITRQTAREGIGLKVSV